MILIKSRVFKDVFLKGSVVFTVCQHESRLAKLSLDSLYCRRCRRVKSDLVLCYKILNNLVSVDADAFLPARRYASAGNSDRNVAVCPSVCPSACLCVCPSRAGIVSKRRKLASCSGSPKTLVFWRQISSLNSKGFHPNGGLKEGG